MRARSSARWVLGLPGLVVAGAAIAGAAGCGPPFDPYNRLNSLRVLAIKSDPIAPAYGETTTLSAATYTTDGSQPRLEWSWCPVTPAAGAPCPFTDEQLTAMTGVPVTLSLGTGKTVSFTHNIPPALLEALCADTERFGAIDCTPGYPIQINLLACIDAAGDGCTADDAQVAAVRPMRLRFRADQDYINTNPTITTLHALIEGMDPPPDLSAATLPRHKATVIATDINEVAAGAETIVVGKDANGVDITSTERLTLTWFVESGDTNKTRSSYNLQAKPPIPAEATTQIKWTPAYAKDDAKDSPRPDKNKARLIVIIRDDRDGVGWTEQTATLEPTP